MRWLTGKASKSLKDWSNASSSEMWDQLDAALSSIAADGHALLDPHLDPFAAIEKVQPLFAKHLHYRKKTSNSLTYCLHRS